MQLDGKRNGLRWHARLLGRNLIKDMQGYALKAKMTQRNCHWCVIALLFQSYLIKAWKQSPNVNSANLLHDLLSCLNSAPANKELHTELTQYLSTGPENVKDPLLWWVEMQAVYPHLSHMACNYLCIPGMFPFLV